MELSGQLQVTTKVNTNDERERYRRAQISLQPPRSRGVNKSIYTVAMYMCCLHIHIHTKYNIPTLKLAEYCVPLLRVTVTL